MPRYVIHVGPHKTGTTFLQTAFTEFRAQLESRGIAYPPYWGGIHGQYPLVARLQKGGDDSLQDEFSNINDSDIKTVLLSSENFGTLSVDKLRLLSEFINGNSVNMVLYCC